MEQILSLYEDFRRHAGSLSGGKGFFDYMAPSSLHSDITCFAYGIRKTMSCVDISENCAVSRVNLEEKDLDRRFYLKLTACLFDWKRYTCGIALTVNGVTAYENGEEFFENVNLGWPTVYIPVDGKLLKSGENLLRLRQTGGDTALLVSVMELVSLPGWEPGQQLSCRRVVRRGGSFGMSFYTAGQTVFVLGKQDCQILETITCGNETVVTLRAVGDAPALKLRIGNKTVDARMPNVVDASPDTCLVGTDSDDHRHDDSDETDRILEIFTNTAMGDYWQARPQHTRNYKTLSHEKTWKRRIDRLKAFDIRFSLADGAGAMPWFSGLCGDRFIGRHFHEAYLFFCAALERSPTLTAMLQIDMPRLRRSGSFGESREQFRQALRRMYESCGNDPGMTSVGSPSLLTVYEARAGFERVTIEPVSNILLLIGAVRGAKPQMWGAHVPTDWYFGEPNDETKSRKFLLAMQQLYMNGADYIYAENSLFKTNAFSREDWDDPFCVRNRQYLREFFDYKEANPRQGQLQKDLAVIYGNNEFFLWHVDDRIAELPENDNWDAKLWGKWEDNSHHRCWRAVDAWLPLAERQNSKENVLNLKLFSGTPYGAVDVVPWDGDFDAYRAVALLGWNTCADGFGEKLLRYISDGGQAFVSACHFNSTDRNDAPVAFDTRQLALLGIAGDVDGFFVTGGSVAVSDEAGNPLVWVKEIGLGKLYFGVWTDYTCDETRMAAMQQVLRLLGEETAQAVCDNPNICFTLRKTDQGQQIVDVLNVCADSTEPQPYRLRLRTGETVTGEAEPCRIQTHRL